jgi:hypothetical protein
MTILLRLCVLIIVMTFALCTEAQPTLSQQMDSILQLPSNYLDKVSSKASQLEQKLDKKTDKMLQVMMKQEAKIIRKLSKIDSVAANNIFSSAYSKYKQLEQNLKSPGKLTQYLPKLDTLATSLKFIENNPQLLSGIKDGKEKLLSAKAKINGLENQLQKAEDIKIFLKERKQFLKEQLSKFGFVKELKKLNKQIYYYNQQVNEYKEILKDPKKAETKAIELLSRTKLFQDFMKKNSMLASFFPMPGGGVSSQPAQATGFAALQTRVQLNTFLQQASFNSSNTMSRFQQNIQGAESQLDQLRNKINQVTGSGGDDLDMPDFKPNSQKTKSFLKRLEYGTTFQSQKASGFFPATSDIGLSVGYKLNDKSVIGIAATYKLGLGTGWNKIKLTNQGMGLRSFVDWKIKGSFWLTGGYEQNYLALFNSVDQLKDMSAWQQSGLLGISKTVSLKSKLLKKTKLQLLWDFLSYQQKPKAQPVLFRVGYNF